MDAGAQLPFSFFIQLNPAQKRVSVTAGEYS